MVRLQTQLKIGAAIVAAAGLGFAASAASANIFLVTYTGTTQYTQDDFGLFSSVIPLDGQTATATFLIDTTPRPGASTVTTLIQGLPPGALSTITAGAFASSPILAASLTVGDVTISCATFGKCANPDIFFLGEIDRYDEVYEQTIGAVWSSPDGQSTYTMDFGAGAFATDGALAGHDLNHFPSLDGSPGEYGGFGFDYGLSFADGSFMDTSVSIGEGTVTVQAVPEPDAWALMIAGFGLAGAALRRRRRTFA